MNGTPSPTRVQPRLRIVPTPDREPDRSREVRPDEDERRALDTVREAGVRGRRPPADGPESQGTLALTFVLPSGVTSDPSPPTLRLLQGGASDPHDHDDFGPQRTPRSDLPDPAAWAPRFVQAVVDVIAGDRPSQQLLRWTSDEVYAQVRRRAQRDAVPRLTSRRSGRRSSVRSTRVSEPADGVVEGCATVRSLDRVRGVAFRLEGTDGRWRCTALEFG